jgi:hypothetical protein
MIEEKIFVISGYGVPKVTTSYEQALKEKERIQKLLEYSGSRNSAIIEEANWI